MIEELRRTLGRLEAALATISDALVITDRTGQLLWCNLTFERLVRQARLFLVGRTITSLLPKDAEDQPLLSDPQLAGAATGSLRAVLCRDPLQAVVIEWRPVLSEPQPPLVFCIRDISADLSNEAMRLEVDRIAQERHHLETRVLTCAVTGLPNRLALEQRLDLVFRRLRDQRGQLSLLFCDLNGFKQVNDLYGHAAGDALLVTVGQRLQAALRADDFVARLGGDEFVVVSAGPATALEAINLAVRLLEELGRPWSLEGRILHPST
ncbi:MAG: diguanylate cyclase domain-containing protein [Cyanobium sp.]